MVRSLGFGSNPWYFWLLHAGQKFVCEHISFGCSFVKSLKRIKIYVENISLCYSQRYAFTEYFAQCGVAYALFRLAFTAHPSNDLCLHQRLTRWIVLQKARRHRINLLRLLVGTQFQVLFHSPPGVLFTFPSRYSFTIDHVIYLALEGGPPGFSQGFSCPDLLKKTHIKSA